MEQASAPGSQEDTSPPTEGLQGNERFDYHLSRALPAVAGRLHARALRLSGGRLGSAKRGVPVAALKVTGRKSGKPREVALMYMADGERHLVVAANAGKDSHPAWYLNLMAAGRAELHVGGRLREVTPRVLSAAERQEIWPRLAAHNPLWEAFGETTARELPVVELRSD